MPTASTAAQAAIVVVHWRASVTTHSLLVRATDHFADRSPLSSQESDGKRRVADK